MLPLHIGGILFPLRVALMRIKITLKGMKLRDREN